MSAFGGKADIDQTCHRDNAAGELRGFLPRAGFSAADCGGNSSKAKSAACPVSERPLPFGDLQGIYAELIGMVLTGDLLVEQALASARSSDAETRHVVDCVNG